MPLLLDWNRPVLCSCFRNTDTSRVAIGGVCGYGYGGVCGYDYMMMAGPGTRLASGRRAPGVPSTVHMAPERARPPQTPKHDRGHRCSGGSRGSTRQGQERPSFLRLHGLSAAGARRIPVIVSARISTSGRTSSGRYFRRLGWVLGVGLLKFFFWGSGALPAWSLGRWSRSRGRGGARRRPAINNRAPRLRWPF